MPRYRLGIIYGGNTIESDYSVIACEELSSKLKSRFDVYCIDLAELVSSSSGWKMLKNTDCVVNLVYGTPGQEGIVPEICDILNIPYLGADQFTLSMVKDKRIAKLIARSYKIDTPDFTYYDTRREECQLPLHFPVVVKPAKRGGLSLGITYCSNKEDFWGAISDAKKYDTKILVEDYVSGREFSVCAIEIHGTINVLPAIEIHKDSQICDYKTKASGQRRLEVNPDLPQKIKKQIEDVTTTLFTAFELRNFAYFDLILCGEKIYFIEAGAVPGFTSNSNFPVSLKHLNLDINEIIYNMVKSRFELY